jgi:hypothetical protein
MLVAFVRYYYPEGGWNALLSMLGFYPFMAAASSAFIHGKEIR